MSQSKGEHGTLPTVTKGGVRYTKGQEPGSEAAKAREEQEEEVQRGASGRVPKSAKGSKRKSKRSKASEPDSTTTGGEGSE